MVRKQKDEIGWLCSAEQSSEVRLDLSQASFLNSMLYRFGSLDDLRTRSVGVVCCVSYWLGAKVDLLPIAKIH